jgi:hypothetical protein
MAAHLYSDQQIERMVRSERQFRVWFCVTSSVILVASVLLAVYRPDLPAFHHPVPVMTVVLVAPLFRIVRHWRTWPEKLKNSLSETSVDISGSTVSVSGPSGYKRQLRLREVSLAEEPSLGTGLYLRTSNRYRWILIPRKLDGYDAIKHEIRESSIVIVKTIIPPNWEEFLGVLLFCGTMGCAVYAHDVRVLTANLFISLLVSFGGYYVINSNPDNLPKKRWSRYAAFLPLAFAAGGLWFAIHV